MTTAARPQRVGFIGLGNMGSRMAANLMKAGHRLTVNDVSAAAAKDLVAKGARFVNTPREAAQDVDAVITMLPSSPHVREVYLDAARGVLSCAPLALRTALTVSAGARRRARC